MQTSKQAMFLMFHVKQLDIYEYITIIFALSHGGHIFVKFTNQYEYITINLLYSKVNGFGFEGELCSGVFVSVFFYE